MFKILRNLFKKKEYTLDNIDLRQPTKLGFSKDEYGEYIVSFWNPIFNEWWTLPSGNAGIHAKWSLLNHGSFGAYSLNKLTVGFHDIDFTKRKFATLIDIQLYLEYFEKDFYRFQKRQEYKNSLPNEIIK